ncbi:Tubulin-specific chaperone A [Triticum urartu]|uniref:Tubulin-specific chaperone A n=2 Tax=Triticinae TaxID=1648030 RepID=M7ZHA5_TRIUA|nr:Tubulin-specific chaperone A [Triticum urartu]
MATLRNLKIKTSTCKRIVKELRSYEKEVEKEAAKTADMKEKGADPYDLKQQGPFLDMQREHLVIGFPAPLPSHFINVKILVENVLAESRMMVPDCHKRLEAALTDLKATLAELKESNEQGTEIGEAEATITEVEAVYTPTEAED